MTKDEEIRLGIKAYGEASLLAAATSTPENLAAVEENNRRLTSSGKHPTKARLSARNASMPWRASLKHGTPGRRDDLEDSEVFRRPRNGAQ